VPRNAVLSLLIAVIVLDLGSLYLLESGLDSFTWWANALVFFATLTFLAVNVANTCLFWRSARSQFGVLTNGVLPLLGVLLNAYLLYAAFFRTLWLGSFRTGKSVVMVCMALLVVQVGALIYVRLFRSHLLTQGTPIGVDGPPPADATNPGVLQPMRSVP